MAGGKQDEQPRKRFSRSSHTPHPANRPVPPAAPPAPAQYPPPQYGAPQQPPPQYSVNAEAQPLQDDGQQDDGDQQPPQGEPSADPNDPNYVMGDVNVSCLLDGKTRESPEPQIPPASAKN